MAPGDAANRQPAASQRAVLLQRLDRVCGTRWIIAARWWKQRREADLIRANEQNENPAHHDSPLNATAGAQALLAEFRDASRVCRWKRTHDHIDVRQNGEHVESYDFAKAAFHAITIDGGVRVSRHDDSRPGMAQKGNDEPNIEVRGSEPLPVQADLLERAFPRQPM